MLGSFRRGQNISETMMFSFTNASQEPYTAMYKVMAGSLQVAE